MSEKIFSLLPPFALLCVGLGSAWVGSGYDIGSLTAMGPGFLPVALGLCLAFLAALLLWLERPVDVDMKLPLRPVICVSIGMIAWVLLADRAGFFAAGLAQVVLSSLALPGQRWLTIAILSIVLNIAAYALFVLVLGLPLPAFGS
jgi:hypothetical protein